MGEISIVVDKARCQLCQYRFCYEQEKKLLIPTTHAEFADEADGCNPSTIKSGTGNSYRGGAEKGIADMRSPTPEVSATRAFSIQAKILLVE
jgi:hypothetical protein